MVSLSPHGALRLVVRMALAAVFTAALHAIAVPSPASAQASEPPPPAQAEPEPEMRAACPGLVARRRPAVPPAALRRAALNGDQVRLTFIGHSTFMIESPDGVRIATDYNDYLKLPALPDIVTMKYTLDLDGMMEVLTALKAQIIIPMHFFGWATLERFLERAGQQWPVERSEVPTLVVSKTTLPGSPKVLVLTGF